MPGTILLVEDEADTREVMTLLLEAEGFAVLPAENGLLGLERLRSSPRVLAALVDVVMPVLDGLGFLRQARGEGQAVPIYILSATCPVRPEGASGFFRKPVDVDRLLGELRRLA